MVNNLRNCEVFSTFLRDNAQLHAELTLLGVENYEIRETN